MGHRAEQTTNTGGENQQIANSPQGDNTKPQKPQKTQDGWTPAKGGGWLLDK